MWSTSQSNFCDKQFNNFKTTLLKSKTSSKFNMIANMAAKSHYINDKKNINTKLR